MAVFSQFPPIGALLKSTGLPKEMFVHQAYDRDNMLDILTPREDVYFGVKSFNVFIAQKPYGWKPVIDDGGPTDTYEFNWPPDGWAASLNRLRLTWSDYFTSYKTVIYVDKYSAARVQAECPESDMPLMMNRTSTALAQFCSENSDLFEFGGNITTTVEMSYFLSRYTTFYGSPAYKAPIV